MKTKYKIKYTQLTPRMARSRELQFIADRSRRNRFYVNLDAHGYDKIVVDIEPKKWWEFWR